MTMEILRDKALYEEISSGRIVVDGLPGWDLTYDHLKSPIQACSIDLSIGDIYYPGVRGDGKRDGEGGPEERCISEDPETIAVHGSVDEHVLMPGKTAYVRTREVIDIPANMAGIAFPPTELARQGILTTNPGHLDPGYHGELHLTLINMGRSCQPLKVGQRIITVLFFVMKEMSEFPYSVRVQKARQQSKNAPASENGEGTQEATEQERVERDVRKLAPDFMNFSKQTRDMAADVAEDKVKSIRDMYSSLTLYGKILTVVGTVLLAGLGALGQCRLSALHERINSLDARTQLTGRLATVEHDVDTIKRSLSSPTAGASDSIATNPANGIPKENLK